MKYLLDMSNEQRSSIKYQAAIEKITMNDLILKAVKEYLEKEGAK